MATEPLIITDFQLGIGASPHVGFGLMRNVDADAFPGALKAGKALTSQFHSPYSQTFTAVAATDVCTAAATVPATKTPVRLTTTGTLPAGLTTNTDYYIINVSSTTFKLASTIGDAHSGTAIDITDTGSGTHTITTTDPGTINHIVRNENDDTGNIFALDSNGRLWVKRNPDTYFTLVKGNTLTNANGNGLSPIIKSSAGSWLFVFRNAVIDVVSMSDFASTPTWTSSWQTLNTGSSTNNNHHCIKGQDDIFYYTDGQYVGSIASSAGNFNPASGATYTFTQDALDIQIGDVAEWLEEQGINLLIAGKYQNKIYPWDRTSDSFNLPIEVPEKYVKRLKNISGNVYILAGSKGNIYSTLGNYAEFVRSIPYYVANNSDSIGSSEVTWGGIAAINNVLLFGAGVQSSGNSGVYALHPDGRLFIEQIPSEGATNATAIYGKDQFYYIGYANGADQVSSSRYSSFEGVCHSGFYRVATKTEKATYSMLEVVIAKPATSGDIRVGYRQDTSSSFTTLATYTADSSTTTFKTDIGLTDIENLQAQVEIDGEMELVEVRFLP